MWGFGFDNPWVALGTIDKGGELLECEDRESVFTECVGVFGMMIGYHGLDDREVCA